MTADPIDVVAEHHPAEQVEAIARALRDHNGNPDAEYEDFESEAIVALDALRDAGLLVTEPPIEVVVLGAGAPVEPDRPGADGSQQVRLRVEGGPPINVGRYTLRPVSPAGGEEQ